MCALTTHTVDIFTSHKSFYISFILTLLVEEEIPGKFQEYLMLYHLYFLTTVDIIHTFAHQNPAQSQSIAIAAVFLCNQGKEQKYQVKYLEEKRKRVTIFFFLNYYEIKLIFF